MQIISGTLDLQPTRAPAGQKPDELMIDCRSLPGGSQASIYIPAANAADILAAAALIQGYQPFAAADPHTVGFDARDIVYFPVPPAAGNLAGLIDVQLPARVAIGARLTVAVTQLSTRRAAIRVGDGNPVAYFGGAASNLTWRAPGGAFQLALHVETPPVTRRLIERKLSILKFCFETIEPGSRWHSVFVRYLEIVAAQLTALGGQPGLVQPYAPGLGHGKTGGCGGEGHAHEPEPLTGKIEALIFDHFGDFEGFCLETFDGDSYEFFSRERNIREIAERAWKDRNLIRVFPEAEHKQSARRIVLFSS